MEFPIGHKRGRGWYLRHGGHETGGHTGGPQALASNKEVSGGEHRGEIPRYYGGEGIEWWGEEGRRGERDERIEFLGRPDPTGTQTALVV